MYKVRIDKFEGPFDLLIYLLENARMDIYDIKVAEITEQYIGYLKEMEELNVEVDTEFIVLAAVLIRLKSRMLLPRINEAGEIEIIEDPRIELRGRLLDYMRIKRAAEMLMAAEEYNLAVHEKPAEDMSEYLENPDEILQVSDEQMVPVESMIRSMTKEERAKPRIINGQRRKRIAQGSGRTVQEVNNLIKQWEQMDKMMGSLRSMAMGGNQRGMGRAMGNMMRNMGMDPMEAEKLARMGGAGAPAAAGNRQQRRNSRPKKKGKQKKRRR